MPVWIQLTSEVYIETRGKLQQYYPGDWVSVGNQYALRLIAQGQAISVEPAVVEVKIEEGSTGIMIFGGGDAPEIGVESSNDGVFNLRWHYTCFWSTDAPVNIAHFATGFNLLKTWDLVVPLYDYRFLAQDENTTEEELEFTKSVIRDLRVPMYDIRLMFAKRTDETIRLFEIWESENNYTRLSFLRALYRAKPLVLALPVTWTGQHAPTHA